MDAINDRVRGRGARLVTLKGPGGIGKTRLSREWGATHSADFPGGAWFVDLASAADADAIRQYILSLSAQIRDGL